MKIKLSKSQWEMMGKKTGWIKTAAGVPDFEEMVSLVGNSIGVLQEARSRVDRFKGDKNAVQWSTAIQAIIEQARKVQIAGRNTLDQMKQQKS